MLTRWAARPRAIRWAIGGIAAVVLVFVVAWFLFVPVADWLARHDVGSAAGPLHETALDNARGRLLTLGAGLVAAGALIFTALNFSLLRRNSQQADQWQQQASLWQQRTHELTEQGQVTDRYTKTIEQLGSDKLDVRIGGIYALERIARDSARDLPTVMEVLTAFIREHSHEQQPLPDPGAPERERSVRPDVRAALTVVNRRDAKGGSRPIDLAGADLTGADLASTDLAGADLSGAILIRADLSFADLTMANLSGASLGEAKADGATLTGANLIRADLTGADLDRAKLARARLDHANLNSASLPGAVLIDAYFLAANLTDANLSGADLTGANLGPEGTAHATLRNANLNYAILKEANLRDADLSGAYLMSADLTGALLRDVAIGGANLVDARWPERTPVPDGWKLDADTGQLRRAGSDPGPVEAG